jgi:hypothetical protein
VAWDCVGFLTLNEQIRGPPFESKTLSIVPNILWDIRIFIVLCAESFFAELKNLFIFSRFFVHIFYVQIFAHIPYSFIVHIHEQVCLRVLVYENAYIQVPVHVHVNCVCSRCTSASTCSVTVSVHVYIFSCRYSCLILFMLVFTWTVWESKSDSCFSPKYSL